MCTNTPFKLGVARKLVKVSCSGCGIVLKWRERVVQCELLVEQSLHVDRFILQQRHVHELRQIFSCLCQFRL